VTAQPESIAARGAHPQAAGNLKLAVALGLAGAAATLLVFPYLAVLMPQRLAQLPAPLWVVALAQTAQAGVLCWLAAWLGLRLGALYGLDAPWLRAWLERRPRDATLRPRWGLAVLWGVLAGGAVAGISLLLTGASAPQGSAGAVDWAWRGALAAFYGAIVEEVLCRLLLVSLLVWLLARFNRRQARAWMYVVAITLAALLFGAGHLPTAFAAGLTGTAHPMAGIVVLNALAGIVFGGLYWRLGLEHAMVAHFNADLVLHVVLPLWRG
jgi:hypothetical protein